MVCELWIGKTMKQNARDPFEGNDLKTAWRDFGAKFDKIESAMKNGVNHDVT
jgi:hypothetical protein